MSSARRKSGNGRLRHLLADAVQRLLTAMVASTPHRPRFRRAAWAAAPPDRDFCWGFRGKVVLSQGRGPLSAKTRFAGGCMHPASAHSVRALGDRLLPAPALRTWRPFPMRFGSWIASGPFHFDYSPPQALYCDHRESTASWCLSLLLAEEKIAEPALPLPCGGIIKADAASLKRRLRGTRENGAACAGPLPPLVGLSRITNYGWRLQRNGLLSCPPEPRQ